MNDNCTIAHTFDYFKGSEVSYALSFLAVGIFAIICIVVLRYLVERKLTASENLRKDNTRQKRMTLSEDITLGKH
jgi:membrane protein implicated in regulation of membrane protease activity